MQKTFKYNCDLHVERWNDFQHVGTVHADTLEEIKREAKLYVAMHGFYVFGHVWITEYLSTEKELNIKIKI